VVAEGVVPSDVSDVIVQEQIAQSLLDENRKLMTCEDNLARLAHLNAIESVLKIQYANCSRTFDDFQQRLHIKNSSFKDKQQCLEALSKNIKLLEQEKQKLLKKIAAGSPSTKLIVDKYDSAISEKERVEKMINRYRNLIKTFQQEIRDLEN
jgi:methionine synthase II (cobalamin-independent)